MRRLLIALSFFISLQASAQSLDKLCTEFITGYNALDIPATELDYKTNFHNIKGPFALGNQEKFFASYAAKTAKLSPAKLNAEEKIRLAQLNYEIGMNLERIRLEKKWNADGRKIPENGFYSLPDHEAWYSYYIKYFTSVAISPPEVFEMGQREVNKVQAHLLALQHKMGFTTDSAFYAYLEKDTFYLTEKTDILKVYDEIDKRVRVNLANLYPAENIPEIGVMEWPNATATTPPGMYQDKERNAYGKDVFLFTFYGQKHNRRAMEWLYMHEGIPGHHLQSVMRRHNTQKNPLQNEFFYFGNSEGWACYVEDHGTEIGMYKDDAAYLGKWEWDLVRSARLVMEVGIHYYGWSYEKALAYWKENIKGQDAIAEREIKRITNWAGQALCYKVGALTIEKIIDQKMQAGQTRKQVNTFLLDHSDVPLQVLKDLS